MGRQPAPRVLIERLAPRSRAAARPDSALASAAPRRMMPAMADLLLRRAPAAPGEVYNVLSGSRIVGLDPILRLPRRPHAWWHVSKACR